MTPAVSAPPAACASSRRVLVTGCDSLDAQTTARACDLAEALGAAIDFGATEAAQTAGPTIARVGELTADAGELRDRADLVVLWFCDPAAGAPAVPPGLVTRATAAGRPRRTIAVGPAAGATTVADHLPVAADRAVDLARLLHAAVTDRAVPAPAGDLAAAVAALRAAVDAADCVACVTHHRDPVGLARWSLVGLLRALARTKPAFEVPLAGGGAAADVCTWRYGAAGAIARADRSGADFRPAECDAVRLIDRREVDCVIVVGPPAASVQAALRARGAGLAVIRLAGDAAALRDELDALLAAVRPRGAAGVAP